VRFLDLRRVIVSMVDLPDFIATEAGVDMIWRSDRSSCKCLCPLHGDSDPSFSLRKHSDGWGYHCFGCGARGTVVEFFQEYYGLNTASEAIEEICNKFGFKDEFDLFSRAIESISQDSNTDESAKIVAIHSMACNQCRLLLESRRDDSDVVKWLQASYRGLNHAVIAGDYPALEMIYDRAIELMEEYW